VQHSTRPATNRPQRRLLAAVACAALAVAHFCGDGACRAIPVRIPSALTALRDKPQPSPEGIAPWEPWFTISKPTTYVTRPLDKGGYVDYVGALNEDASKGVTVDNNAAVLLVRVMDLSLLTEVDRARFYALLGVKPPPKTAEMMQTFPQEATAGDLESATTQPWWAGRFPVLFKWLAEKDKALDLAVEASRRPRCYFPFIWPKGVAMVQESPLPAQDITYVIAHALAARAMLRLNNGEIAKAEEDLLACRRLGRLVGSGPLVSNALVGLYIDDRATRAEAALLEFGKLSAADALAYRDQLRKLSPLPNVADRLDRGERFLFLTFATQTIRNFEGKLALIFFIPGVGDLFMSRFTAVWDQTLRAANREWDKWVLAVRTPSAAFRRKKMDALAAEMKTERKPDLGKAYAHSPLEAGRLLGRSMVALLLPDVKEAPFQEERIGFRFEMMQAGFALAAYRADFGKYPASLNDLVPKYCSEVPRDYFSGKPLHYRLRPEGYHLYSVGTDGRDDEGRGVNSLPKGDDIALVIPREREPARPQKGGSTSDAHELAKVFMACGFLLTPLAFVGGLAILFYRVKGRLRAPIWLVSGHAVIAVTALGFLSIAAVVGIMPALGMASLGFLAAATIGAGVSMVAYRRREKPIPVRMVVVHVVLLTGAWVSLTLLLWRVGSLDQV
jgi:hypothetical protein